MRNYFVTLMLILPVLLMGQSQTRLDESFEPTNLSDWPDSKDRIERIKSLQEHLADKSLEENAVETLEVPDFVFRVQIGSTMDFDVAQSIEEDAAGKFDEEIQVQFDSPYYKIRVGSLHSRDEARELQQLAVKNGYRRAWVIRTENNSVNEE